LWTTVESEWFNQGCDLLITSYDTDEVMHDRSDRPLTIEAFCATLEYAVGWLTPLDSNLGFIVGVPSHVDMSRLLHP
jgi:hypothetical protein